MATLANAPAHAKITPWGTAQEAQPLGEGILFVSTPSHGGFYVPPTIQAELARTFPDFRPWTGSWQWLEEDCDWVLLALIRPQISPRTPKELARIAQAMAEREANRHPSYHGPVCGWQHVVDVLPQISGARNFGGAA